MKTCNNCGEEVVSGEGLYVRNVDEETLYYCQGSCMDQDLDIGIYFLEVEG